MTGATPLVRTALTSLVLVAAVALGYANALAGPFQFDDWWAIVDNPRVHSLAAWWQALPGIRPLLKLSYALNWQLSPSAWSFHAFNIAIHAINSLLVWALARRWLPWLAPDLPAPPRAAFAVALLFALHPAATEAVTYISGRSLSLMALFYFAALLSHDEAERRRSGWLRWCLTPLLFALALAVRETAITLPLAVLLFAWCRGERRRECWSALQPLLPVLALAILAALATPGYWSFFGWSLQTRELGPQLLGQLEAHRYLLTGPLPGLCLNIDPDLRVPAALDAGLLAFALAALAVLAFAVNRRKQHPWLLFGFGWYALHLLPSNSLLPRFDLGNDRHLYLALLGPMLWLAVGLGQLRPPRIAAALLAALALVSGQATVQRNRDYRSELVLWQATVAGAPAKPRPRVNLGWARQQVDDRDGAIREYRCALALDSGQRQARLNLLALGQTPRPGPCRAP